MVFDEVMKIIAKSLQLVELGDPALRIWQLIERECVPLLVSFCSEIFIRKYMSERRHEVQFKIIRARCVLSGNGTIRSLLGSIGILERLEAG